MARTAISPSLLARRIACPGSLRAEEHLPDEPSPYAEEGTRAHALGEMALREQLLGETPDYKAGNFDPEMFDAIAEYRRTVTQLLADYMPGGKPDWFAIEQEMDLEGLLMIPTAGGTPDFAAMGGNTLVVVDYKHGQGVDVAAEGNPQVMAYAWGALEMVEPVADVQDVVLCICQPRKKSAPDVWTTPAAELRRWADEVARPACEVALRRDGPQVPGSHCKFCKARHTCRARAAEAETAAFQAFGDRPGGDMLTADEVAQLLPRLPLIKDWAEGLLAFAASAALAGQKFPGYKLVAGRSYRVWTNEAAAAEQLRTAGLAEHEIYEKKFLGITAAEKLVGKKHPVFELTRKPQGKPTLVPESDKRPAWQPVALDAFDDAD